MEYLIILVVGIALGYWLATKYKIKIENVKVN